MEPLSDPVDLEVRFIDLLIVHLEGKTQCFLIDFEDSDRQKKSLNFHDLPLFVQPNATSLYPNLAPFPSFGIYCTNFMSFLIERHADVGDSFETAWRPLWRNWPNYTGFINIFERPHLGHCGSTSQ